jgi:glycosyltransferase involved in cell wall biosynthesis
VCVSGPWLDTLRGLVPEQPVSKFEVHPNGYAPWHFRGKDPGAPTVFRVAYTGTFYGHRSPRAFMQGVARAIQDGRIPADAIEVVLVGHSEPAMMMDVIPTARVRALDHRPFHETIRLLRDAAVLLLVIPTEGGPGNHTGKLFNYLAARRPILALSPEPNVAADLIRASRSGRVVPPDDPRAVADALAGLYAEWKSGRGLLDQDREMIAAYDAAGQARRYAALLDRVSGQDLAGE